MTTGMLLGLVVFWLAIAAALLWWTILLLPWRPWSPVPYLDAGSGLGGETITDVTVLIPARNEASHISKVLASLRSQPGCDLKIVLVDDQSTDGTADTAHRAGGGNLVVLSGKPLPEGWSGKVWALEQGRQRVDTTLTLLLDADIQLQPGLVRALWSKRREEDIHLVSLMAVPPLSSLWERALLPAFVYFFKLLYPFRLANSPTSQVAAASGGCILLETRLLTEIGGFAAIKDALIDDCTLAHRIKSLGYGTWLGLTHSAISLRHYPQLSDIGNMVARTAFTQLRYSLGLLLGCSFIMALAFWAPVAGLMLPSGFGKIPAMAALVAMLLSYLPILRFYGLAPAGALLLPLVGTWYLAMTWRSAIRYWRGERARWRDRLYGRGTGAGPRAML